MQEIPETQAPGLGYLSFRRAVTRAALSLKKFWEGHGLAPQGLAACSRKPFMRPDLARKNRAAVHIEDFPGDEARVFRA